MNEIDLWNEAQGCDDEKEERLKDIGYNLFELFAWSDNPTNEEDFDEIYNKIWEGKSFKDIAKEKNIEIL